MISHNDELSIKKSQELIKTHGITSENASQIICTQLEKAAIEFNIEELTAYENLTRYLVHTNIITTSLIPELNTILYNLPPVQSLVELTAFFIFNQKISSTNEEESQEDFGQAVFGMYELLIYIYNHKKQETWRHLEEQLFSWLQSSLQQNHKISKEYLIELFRTDFSRCWQHPFRTKILSHIFNTHTLQHFSNENIRKALIEAVNHYDSDAFKLLLKLDPTLATDELLALAMKKFLAFYEHAKKVKDIMHELVVIIRCCLPQAKKNLSSHLVSLLSLNDFFSFDIAALLNLINEIVTSGKCSPINDEPYWIIFHLLNHSKQNHVTSDLAQKILLLNTEIFIRSKYQFQLLDMIAEFSEKTFKAVLAIVYDLEIDFTNMSLVERRKLLFKAIQHPGNTKLVRKILTRELFATLNSFERATLFSASQVPEYKFLRNFFEKTPAQIKEIEGFFFCKVLLGLPKSVFQEKPDDPIGELVIEGWISKTLINFIESIKSNLKEAILYYLEMFSLYLKTYQTNFLCNMQDAEFFNLMNLAITIPEISRIIGDEVRLQSITLKKVSNSTDTWSELTRNMLQRLSQLIQQPSSFAPSSFVPQQCYPTQSLDELKKSGWIFLRLQGRTIILAHTETKNLLAIKVRKAEEKVSTLDRECETVRYFRQHKDRLSIKSKLPTPRGVFQIDGLVEWLKSLGLPPNITTELLETISHGSSYFAYIYEVDKDHHHYFTYLHDPVFTDQEFALANRIAVNDLYHLLQQGFVYHQLADIFHDNEAFAHMRPDSGRYYALINLVCSKKPSGGGEVMNWEDAVAFVNIRLGLADLGDWTSSTELRRFLPTAPNHSMPTENKNNWIARANFLAEYHLILEICAGLRGKRKNSQWLILAKQLISNAAYAIAITTRSPEYIIQQFLERWINIPRYAQQLEESVTGKWVHYLTEGFPETFFGPGVKVHINYDVIEHKELLPTMLGTYSGQYPIKEGEKLRYVMIMAIAALLVHQEKIQTCEKTLGYKYFSLWRDKIYQRKKVLNECGENEYFPTLRKQKS